MIRNSTKALAGLAILAIAPMVHAQSQPCALMDIAWMAGSWHNAANPDRAQETWSLAPNGVLMGSAWEFPPGKTGFAEIMTVRSDGDSGDHAGERMSYRRSGNKLTIVADFLHHGTPDHEEWHMIRVRT